MLARIIHQALGRLLPRAAPLIAVGAMAGYALLAGASAAALRAAAMGVLVVIAGRLRRDSHVFVSLALTAAIMLGLKPGLARDVSFQLSFAGTAGIAAMTDGIAARLKLLPGVLREPFAATVAAEAATWPLMLANFHQVSLIGPVANALVLPLLPAVMIVGGAGALLGSPLPAAGLASDAGGRHDRELVSAGDREPGQPSSRRHHDAVLSATLARCGAGRQWWRARGCEAAPVLLA